MKILWVSILLRYIEKFPLLQQFLTTRASMETSRLFSHTLITRAMIYSTTAWKRLEFSRTRSLHQSCFHSRLSALASVQLLQEEKAQSATTRSLRVHLAGLCTSKHIPRAGLSTLFTYIRVINTPICIIIISCR
jgi:hypothetical protein